MPWKGDGYAKNEFNFVVEIPQNRLAKLEICKETKFNPIVQDSKVHPIYNTKVDRFYYIFPAFNYGIIPQTYESPQPMPEFNSMKVAKA